MLTLNSEDVSMDVKITSKILSLLKENVTNSQDVTELLSLRSLLVVLTLLDLLNIKEKSGVSNSEFQPL